jgi:hypothetical protein
VCVCVCVCGTRLSTCTAGTLPSEPNLQSILLGYFGDGVLQTICQLVLNCNFPDLSHSNSWDYRCQFLMPGWNIHYLYKKHNLHGFMYLWKQIKCILHSCAFHSKHFRSSTI